MEEKEKDKEEFVDRIAVGEEERCSNSAVVVDEVLIAVTETVDVNVAAVAQAVIVFSCAASADGCVAGRTRSRTRTRRSLAHRVSNVRATRSRVRAGEAVLVSGIE